MPKNTSKITAQKLERKHQQLLNTFVRESWAEIPMEMEVKLSSCKAWGFDLIRGLRQGQEAIFIAPSEKKRHEGDRYEEGGQSFEVRQLVKELNPNERLFVRVTQEERRGVIRAFHEGEDKKQTELFALPAAELLLAYFKKQHFAHLLNAFHSSGLTSEFIQKRGEGGKAYEFESLPNTMRRALREAKDVIKKDFKVGRFSLVYFGQNKNGNDRYIITWQLPTIRMFNQDLANKIDKLLAALD